MKKVGFISFCNFIRLRLFFSFFLVTFAHYGHTDESPNFIVVLLDDFGWSSMSQSMDQNYPNAKVIIIKPPILTTWLIEGCDFPMATLPLQCVLRRDTAFNLEKALRV
jgi:hypothetical protein